MTPFSKILTLIFVLAAVLLAAGCTTHQTPISNNQTGPFTTPSTVTPVIPLSKALYMVTIGQANDSPSDLIKMDSDVFN